MQSRIWKDRIGISRKPTCNAGAIRSAMFKLYYAQGTIAAAVAIALKEVDADFEGVALDFSNAEQRGEAYLEINPKGRVPALVTENGTLTETLAILCHICDLFPKAGLRPETPYEVAQMQSVMTYLASTAHVNHAHRMRGARWADKPESWEDMRLKVPQTMAETANYLEHHCLKGPFVMGDRFSVADAYLFVVCTWFAGDGVDITKFPKLAKFFELVGNRPAVRSARVEGYL